MAAKKLWDCQNDPSDGFFWDARENSLYWLAINQAKIQRHNPHSKDVKVIDMPTRVTALGLHKRGRFVCSTEKGFHFGDGKGTELEFISHFEQDKAGV